MTEMRNCKIFTFLVRIVLLVVLVPSLTRGATAVGDSKKNGPFAPRPTRRLAVLFSQNNNQAIPTNKVQQSTNSLLPQQHRNVPPYALRGGNYFHDYYSKGLSIQFAKGSTHGFWWIFPFVVMVTAYATFPALSQAFDRLVLWISDDGWLPDTPEKMSLLSNVLTQVVNGPVVTSISVLFATLISVTISTLHSRQQDVQLSLINEVEALRNLETTLASPVYTTCTTSMEKLALASSVEELRTAIATESAHQEARPQRHQSDPHEYIALQSDQLWNLCDCMEADYVALMASDSHSSSSRRNRGGKQLEPPPPRPDPRPLLDKIRTLIQTVRSERKARWIAVTSMHFPLAHYLTLCLLVVSILVAFLVTTDEADFIFLQGLQVRILWSVLVTCFSSLAVVCVDLSDAFSGAYAVAKDFQLRGTEKLAEPEEKEASENRNAPT